MKKIIPCLLFLILLTACGEQPVKEEIPVCSGEIAVPQFDTVEEFEAAIFAPPKDMPAANYEMGAMDTIKKYFVPDALPEGYVLHRIDAGKSSVWFEYIPADAENPDVARYTDCIEFAFYRESHENPARALLNEHPYASVSDGVLMDEENGRCYWVQDDSILCLSKPTDPDLPPEELIPYCSAKVVIVER